ncbi:MAG TPA: oligosaccharide flippase family protein [Anaerolineaceae bacterium]|nr:oligosaccharide flippase family protein [Anaerolineaceae bacterium]
MLKQWRQKWQQDKQLGMVIRNSGYLFSSNSISMVLASLVGLAAALLLGPVDYGVLGMITLFASSINRLLSFRMGELVVKYAGGALALDDKPRAAAIIKFAAIAESITSLLAYAILVGLADLAARFIVKDPSVTVYILVYGLMIIGNMLAETGTAVLQITNHFRSQAILNLFQNVTTAVWIGIAFLTKSGLGSILAGYLIGKLIFGIGTVVLMLAHAPVALGKGWWRTSLKGLSDWRSLSQFAFTTNLSGTINMVIRDSEVLWVGFFLTKADAGYYKFALAIMNIILMPISPFINTTFPQISSSVAKFEWQRLKTLLQRTTLIAAAWTAACAVGLLLVGKPILGWLNDGAYLPAYSAILVLLIGFGMANIFFWNRPLLLSLGKPGFPLKITAIIGAIKTGLMFVLVRPFGILAQAGLLSFYFVTSVGLIVWKGLREITAQQRANPDPEDAS